MKIKKLLLFLLALCMTVSSLIGNLNNVAYAATPPGLTLTATAQASDNYIGLSWDNDDSSQNYHYMITKRDADIVGSTAQTIPLKGTTRVLNIYPGGGTAIADKTDLNGRVIDTSANLKVWMEDDGYGKDQSNNQIITVDSVYIDDFSLNPSSYLYKDGNNEYNYDVVFAGSWDSNNSKDISVSAKDTIQNFINAGGGYLAGHDTADISCRTNLVSLASDNINMICSTDFNLYGGNAGNVNISVIKKGSLVNYPWVLSSDTLSVPGSHASNQFAKGDVWMQYNSNTWPSTLVTSYGGSAGTNNFYLTTWNNAAMIQAGHSNGNATNDEKKVLANTLLYLSQISTGTTFDDHTAQDVKAPNTVANSSVVVNGDHRATLTFSAPTDNGNTYEYQLKAIGLTDNTTYSSATITKTITSGLKGYAISVDQNPNTNPGSVVNSTNTSYTSNVLASGDWYFHVNAIDNVGNVSSTVTTQFTVMATTPTPSFNPVGGAIAFGNTVSITSGGAEHIYYTTNGTDPATSVGGATQEYTNPIAINSAMTIKAIATRTNYYNSEIGSVSYTQDTTSDLTGLVLSGTPSNYTFVGNTYTYNGVTVSNEVNSITVTPTGAGTITVDGTTVISGQASQSISLIPGVEKTITIIATETGKSSKTYTIKLTRIKVAPSAPIIAAGSVGNGTATIAWAAVDGAEEYKIYESTTSGVYSGALETVASNICSYQAIGLINCTPYYFVVKASNSVGESGYSNEVNAIPSSGISSALPVAAPLENNNVNVIVNGQNQSAATSQTTNNLNGQRVTTVVVDDKKIEEKLSQEGNNANVIIPINTEAEVITGELNGQTVKNMENKEAVLNIKTENVTYTLPASQINIDDVSSQIGQQVELKDIKVTIQIAEPSADTVKVVENTANKNNYQVVVKPIEFNITCSSGDKTVEVSKFNGYVERTVAIPDGIDPSKITTGIVLNTDGTFSHIPTQIILIDSKYYVKINSLTNSTYSAIYNPIEFADVVNHWSKDAVNNMGSRLVIEGVGNNKFEPDKDITRAEFAAIVVRGLGLMRPNTGKDCFSDVTKDKWYYDAVSIASEYKLIEGYENNAFKPEDKITREEAMTLITRAMQLAKMNREVSDDETKAQLDKFKDKSEISEWAKGYVAACVKNEIVLGDNGLIKSKYNITRAEVATIVQRMLKKAGLI